MGNTCDFFSVFGHPFLAHLVFGFKPPFLPDQGKFSWKGMCFLKGPWFFYVIAVVVFFFFFVPITMKQRPILFDPPIYPFCFPYLSFFSVIPGRFFETNLSPVFLHADPNENLWYSFFCFLLDFEIHLLEKTFQYVSNMSRAFGLALLLLGLIRNGLISFLTFFFGCVDQPYCKTFIRPLSGLFHWWLQGLTSFSFPCFSKPGF